MKINYLVFLLILITNSFTAYGWGQKGHDMTACIAENHLTPTAYQVIGELLDGKSIIYWSNWLDNVSHTPEYAYTKTWHYKNIDDGFNFENAPLLETGDIISAIHEQVNVLQQPMTSREAKQQALKFLVHLMGDLHQPVHLGHASDRGGNQWPVNYFGRESNLHSVWDNSLPEAAHKWTYSEWQDQIDRLNDSEIFLIPNQGNPEKWGNETYELCKTIYESTPENTNIDYNYINEWTPTLESLFLKGGLRLADVLNSIFDPDYLGLNTFINK